MTILARIGLRQLIVLLMVTGLLVAGVYIFWSSNTLHQQALREHDLQRQQQFARQLVSRLQDRLKQETLDSILDSVMLDEQMQVWVVDANGNVLYPPGDDLTSSQSRALQQSAGLSGTKALVADEQGREQLTSVVSLEGSGGQLLLQTPLPASGNMMLGLREALTYSLPLVFLLAVMIWLAAGWLVRPFRQLAGYARNLGRADTIESVHSVPVSSREAEALRKNMIRGMEQLHPRSTVGKQAGMVDELTGLSTPEVLPELMANLTMSGDMTFAAVVLSVDDYEQMQADFGQQECDKALKELAGILLKGSRELDVSVRLSEEIFLLMLPQCPAVIAQRIAERLRSKIEGNRFSGVEHMTISAGVGIYQPGTNEPMDALKQAQQLLINAKREGQNRVLTAS